MKRGVIGRILENRGAEETPRAARGAAGAGSDFERAAELGHALAHAGNADAEARLAAVGRAIGRNGHAAAEVGDFEGDAVRILAEGELGALAAGRGLAVGGVF